MGFGNRTSENDPSVKKTNENGGGIRFLRRLTDNKVIILFIFGIVSILLGTIGFNKYFGQTNESKSLATSIYNALWLFTIEAGNLSKPIPWELEISRWLSPAVAAYAIILGFAALFRDQVRFMSLRLIRNHVIICGLGQKGFNIARDFRENDYDIVIIEKDGNNPNIASCREFGAIVLVGDCRDTYLLEKAGIKKARYLVGVCGDDGVNADIAVIAKKLVTTHTGDKLNCIIHIMDPKLWVLLRTQEFTATENAFYRLDIFNIYDQGSKQLFREFPLHKGSLDKTSIPHLVIIDTGDFAEQLILNAARKWSPIFDEVKQKIYVSIIDPMADIFIERLSQAYNLVDTLCEWEALAFDTDSIDFIKAEFLLGKGSNLSDSTVYVMCKDEKIGLSSALTLQERLRPYPVRILVRMEEEKGLANLIREARQTTGSYDRLFLFGLMERTCKLSLIKNSSHEAISRAIHEEYLRVEKEKGNLPGSSPTLVDWDYLPEDIKNMNREQADSISEKLSAVGCGIIPWVDYGAEKFTFNLVEIETMAVMEHKRWVNQKIKQGWVFGQERDDRAKIHPCLVPYDDPSLPEAEKEKDRNTVRQIPYFLSLAGYQIQRAFQ